MAKKNITSTTPVDSFRLNPTTFNTSSNYTFDFDKPGDTEFFTEPSLTEPDQCYTVQELLNRHISGSLPDISQPYYYDTDVQDPHGFDNVDPTMRPDFDLADYASLSDNLANHRLPVDGTQGSQDPQKQLPEATSKPDSQPSTGGTTPPSLDGSTPNGSPT